MSTSASTSSQVHRSSRARAELSLKARSDAETSPHAPHPLGHLARSHRTVLCSRAADFDIVVGPRRYPTRSDPPQRDSLHRRRRELGRSRLHRQSHRAHAPPRSPRGQRAPLRRRVFDCEQLQPESQQRRDRPLSAQQRSRLRAPPTHRRALAVVSAPAPRGRLLHRAQRQTSHDFRGARRRRSAAAHAV